jgi:hypothetical protein
VITMLVLSCPTGAPARSACNARPRGRPLAACAR